ncbi:MAG: T9SS type A sorting domain-containing protein [Flavobacteriales bacterium]|nr:T9SS type A sorting domain-containing protein [Flavobacteriales bacterium]
MKLTLSFGILFASTATAQVTNEVSVYVKSGTDVYVTGTMTNTSTGIFTVESDGLLTVGSTLVNNGSMTFNNSASLMRGSAGSDGTGSGTYYVKRQGSNSGSVYNYWSSPMTSFSGVPGNNPYLYDSDESTQTYTDDQPADPGWFSYNGLMTPGKGYIGRGAGLTTFSGNVNNGNVNFPMIYHAYSPGNTAAGTPFNLCGNPYPSAISCASLVAANTDVNGSIYFWDDDLSGGSGYSSTDYAIWNGTGSLGTGSGSAGAPNGYISSGQAFMIRALNGSAVLNFTNAMRVGHFNTQFFKTESADAKLWFSIEGLDYFNQILIGVLEDATDGEDRLYDAVKIRGNSNISLAAIDNGTDYAILAFPPPTEGKIIPLSVLITESGTYRFKANTMENFAGMDVYFVDTQTGEQVLLQEGTEISLQIDPALYEDRFYLNFGQSGMVTGISEESAGLNIYSFGENLYISSLADGNAEFELFDVGGRAIMQMANIGLNRTVHTISLNGISTGIYLAHVKFNGHFYVQKIVRP